jgi:hypothetical protein
MNDRQVLDLRGRKTALDERRAYAAVWEEEPGSTGTPVPTAVLFLTNYECPLAKTDQPVTSTKRIGIAHWCCNIKTLPSPSPGI